jgi:hypothetical protein
MCPSQSPSSCSQAIASSPKASLKTTGTQTESCQFSMETPESHANPQTNDERAQQKSLHLPTTRQASEQQLRPSLVSRGVSTMPTSTGFAAVGTQTEESNPSKNNPVPILGPRRMQQVANSSHDLGSGPHTTSRGVMTSPPTPTSRDMGTQTENSPTKSNGKQPDPPPVYQPSSFVNPPNDPISSTSIRKETPFVSAKERTQVPLTPSPTPEPGVRFSGYAGRIRGVITPAKTKLSNTRLEVWENVRADSIVQSQVTPSCSLTAQGIRASSSSLCSF